MSLFDINNTNQPGFGSQLLGALGISSKAIDSALGTNTTELANIRRAAEQKAAQQQLEKQASELAKENEARVSQEQQSSIWSNPALINTGIAAGTGLLGYGLSKADNEKALATLQNAADLAGLYKSLGPSQTSLIQDNPELQAMQMRALQNLQEVAMRGSTAEDDAYQRKIQNENNAAFMARQKQIQDSYARRGAQVGSGFEASNISANNLAAQQQLADSEDSRTIQREAAKRNALSQLSSQSSQMQQEQFNRNATRAGSLDKFNELNVQNEMTANRNRANMLAPVASAQSQLGTNKANLVSTIGNAGISALQNYVFPKK